MPEVDDIQLRRFYTELGGRIRAMRTARKVTQDGLAAELGLTRSSVANIEAGRQRFPVHTLVLITEFLRTTPNALLEGMSISHENADYSDVHEHLEGAGQESSDFVTGTLAELLNIEGSGSS